MRVFHGSTVAVSAPLVGVGRKNLDFGPGFYVTDLRAQAVSWASRPSNAGQTHVLSIYDFDIEAAKEASCRYKRFVAYDAEWLAFVVASRKGQPVWQDYDVIEGGIANDRVFNTIELFIQGLISEDEALQRLRYELPNNQICILSQSVVDHFLHFVSSETILDAEVEL